MPDQNKTHLPCQKLLIKFNKKIFKLLESLSESALSKLNLLVHQASGKIQYRS